MDTTEFAINDRVSLGGSIGTVIGVGILNRGARTEREVVFLTCPDYGPGVFRIAGHGLYALALVI